MLGYLRVSIARPRPADKIEHGFDHAFPDREPAHEPLGRHEVIGIHCGFCFDAGIARRLDEDPAFRRAIGISDIDLHEKAIELGLGQGIGTLLLERILRRENMKGARQIVSFAGYGDVVFLHRLEQRGLGSGTCPVDFVGHEQLGEYGSAHEAKTAASLDGFFEDFGSQNIGGHQIRRELDAARIQAKNGAKGFDKLGFGEAWHTDEQPVTARKQRDQGLFDNVCLAEDDCIDQTPRRRDPLKRRLGCGSMAASSEAVITSGMGVLAFCLVASTKLHSGRRGRVMTYFK